MLSRPISLEHAARPAQVLGKELARNCRFPDEPRKNTGGSATKTVGADASAGRAPMLRRLVAAVGLAAVLGIAAPGFGSAIAAPATATLASGEGPNPCPPPPGGEGCRSACL
ncbi:hypothetical protein [Amycolatopsis sp. NPDC054798]